MQTEDSFDNEPRLRSEADWHLWSQMTASQRSAFDGITQALAVAVKSVDSIRRTDNDRNSPPVRGVNCNRTLMLSGDRGMGKTSLLMSLQLAFQNPRLWESSTKTTKEGKRSGSQGKAPWDSTSKYYEPIKNRVVWLELLDMEPLPAPANLMVAILARIDRAIRHEGSATRGSELDISASSDSVLLELKRLITDASLAWNGNVEERAANLDPDVYASEVLRAEEARLRLIPRLNNVLDRLAKEIRWKNVDDPIFVLPVDDVDLNPIRCLELLRLIRILKAPRLVTIVLGDATETEQVLAMKLSGEMARVGNTQNAGSVFEHDLFMRMNCLANQSMRKLIPPSQRFALEPMTVEESLAFSPRPGLPTLEVRLKQLPLKLELPSTNSSESNPQAAISSLYDLLFPPTIIIRAEREQIELEGQHLSSEAARTLSRNAKLLEAPPRIIQDIYRALTDQDGKVEPEDHTRYLLLKLAEEALLFDSRLNLESRKQLESLIHGIKTDACFRTRYLDIQPSSIVAHYMTGNLNGFANEYYFRDLVEHKLRVRGTESDYRDRRSRNQEPQANSYAMSEATEGYFSALYDTIALQSNQPIIGDWLVNDAGGLGFAEARWNVKGEQAHVAWMGPMLRSFVELDQFKTAWREILRSIQRSIGNRAIGTTTIQNLAYHWVGLSCAVLLGETYQIRDSMREPFAERIYRDVDPLVLQMERLISNQRQHGVWRRKISLVHFGALLSFETGIPKEFSEPFWESKKLCGFWEENENMVKQIREAVLNVKDGKWSMLQMALARPMDLLRDIKNRVDEGYVDQDEDIKVRDVLNAEFYEIFSKLPNEMSPKLITELIDLIAGGVSRKFSKQFAPLLLIVMHSIAHPSNQLSFISLQDEE